MQNYKKTKIIQIDIKTELKTRILTISTMALASFFMFTLAYTAYAQSFLY